MFCVLDQNEVYMEDEFVKLISRRLVGRTTRFAFIVKSEVNAVFDSSFTLAYWRKNENLNQSANGEQPSITMERWKLMTVQVYLSNI